MTLMDEISKAAKKIAKEIIEKVEYEELKVYCMDCDSVEMFKFDEYQNIRRYHCSKCGKNIQTKIEVKMEGEDNITK